MKFTKGDKVLVRYHTEKEKRTYKFGWITEMNVFEGHVGTVTTIGSSFGRPGYRVQYEQQAFDFLESSLSLANYDQF